jgi:Zn-dependent hydrolase of the beta-lactamase fold-like protein
MFDIEYKGGNGIILTSKGASIVVDPRLSLIGLKDLKTKDAIELVTEGRFRVDDSGARITIDSPGEYEVGDFTIRGIAATRHVDTSDQEKLSTIYQIECGDVRVAIIGNIGPKLTDEQMEGIGVVDVLLLPVGGGGYTLDATSASSLVRNIEPKVVIPIHYAEAGISYEVPQDTLDVFIKELGAPVEQLPKLKIKSASSLPQTLTVMELSRS